MAQQASPNSIYHWDEARPQLSSSSTLVVKTVSGSELISGFIEGLQSIDGSSFNFLHPIQIAFNPGINQTQEKNADKHQNFDQCEQPCAALNPAAKHSGYRKHEGDFDFEDDEY